MSIQELKAYQQEVENWHQQRVESLLSEEGWLNLAGLYWLEPGVNTFGTGADRDIQFPEGSVSPNAGILMLINNRVTARFHPDADILVNGSKVSEATVFDPESAEKVIMDHENYRWIIIRREDKFGIRLRDLKHPRLKKFKGIERFTVNPDFRFEATLQVSDTIRTIAITNVLGQTTQQRSAGTLRFIYQGQLNQLDVIDEGNGGDYFIVFGDQTNGKTTYDAGRFLYVPRPGTDGVVMLDFNRSFNPPCAFSPFATCPLPPPQNHLDLMVEAGEKKFHLD